MSTTMTTPLLEASERRQLEETLRPLADAGTLPPWCYTSPEFYETEVRGIFLKEWLGVGRVDEIAQPGDYLCASIVGEPIVVLRDKDGAVRAFSRACRHRGACVVEGRGNAKFFRCPFHGWTYDLGGQLIAARQMEDTTGFDRTDYPLPELRVEVWQGFIFVNFDTDAKPLSPHLGKLETTLERYRLEEMRATTPMPFWNQCNWKLACEQAMDMYHVPDTHFMPKAAKWTGRAFGEEDPSGLWTMMYTASRERVHPYVTGTNQIETPFPAIEGLSDTELGSFTLLLIYPSTIITVLPQGALTFFFYPHGPGRTDITLNLHFHAPAFEMDDFDRHLRDTQEGLIVTNNQDMHSAKLAQRGMQSKLLTPGRYSYLERTTWELDRYVARKVMAAS